MSDQSVEQELKQAKQVLQHWGLYAPQIMGVRKLEQGTMYTPKAERDKGYPRLDALQGYEQIINAYMLVGNVSKEQRDNLQRVSDVLNDLQEDQKRLGDFPTQAQAARYAADMVQELDRKTQIYMQSGHEEHFNITRIRKLPDGNYSYTLYDSGHESQVIDWKDGRPVINAMQEFMLKPGTDIKAFIEADVNKKASRSDTAEYKAAKQFMEDAFIKPSIRMELEYGQRKGNCTTRGQRLLAADILQDPRLSEGLYDFASSIKNLGMDDIRESLKLRVEYLEGIKAGKLVNNAQQGMAPGLFLKALNAGNFEMQQIPLDSGGLMDSYRSKPGVFAQGELKEIQSTLMRYGVEAKIRESMRSPGNFYLYVAPDEMKQVAEALVNDQSAVGVAYRKTGENLQLYLDTERFLKFANQGNFENATIPAGNGPMKEVFRSKPGAFSKGDLEILKDTLKRNGIAAEIQESMRQPGNFYIHLPKDGGFQIPHALARDGSPAADMVRRFGHDALAHVPAFNAPLKPQCPMDVITDGSRWHHAKREDNVPVIRVAIGEMRESQILALEKELVKSGFRPVRHDSATMGPTLRIEGDDVKRLTQWQGDLEKWKQKQLKQADHKPNFISAFLDKILHKDEAPHPAQKNNRVKPAGPSR